MEAFLKQQYEILEGNCLETLKSLPDNSVQCCVTSPPYYGLRDYGTGHWEGGDPNCPHYRTSKYSESDCTGHKAMGDAGQAVGDAIYKTVCPLCGAVRVDEQIGLEETPEQYIDKLVQVFREVKRVLKDDGTLWVNIGDSYCGTGDKGNTSDPKDSKGSRNGQSTAVNRVVQGCKQKDLIGIPWMLAFALRNDGWYLRQDIIWQKQNPMPEPVKDRCVKSHEYIFLLSKSGKYSFNYEAIQEDAVTDEHRPSGVARERLYDYDSKTNLHPEAYRRQGPKFGGNKYGDSDDKHYAIYSGNEYISTGKRNKRDVWTVGVNTYRGAHFATFPTKLIEPCILAGSSEGDIVLDPFNGSGTTGFVAMSHGRKYIGCELNPEYIKLTEERFNDMHSQTTVYKDKETGQTQTIITKDLFD